jgi:hypothetical protein
LEDKPDFSSVGTSKIDASIGLYFLKNMFSQMGALSLSSAIQFSKINKIELSYINVKSEAVDPVKIAHYIDIPATPSKSEIICDQLEADKTYIIYDILKSDSFSMACYANEKADAKTEVDIIKKIVKDESDITMNRESDNTIIFKGADYQTFAIRVRPFWITEDKTGKKSFYFKPRRRSWFERSGILNWFQGTIKGSESLTIDREREIPLQGSLTDSVKNHIDSGSIPWKSSSDFKPIDADIIGEIWIEDPNQKMYRCPPIGYFIPNKRYYFFFEFAVPPGTPSWGSTLFRADFVVDGMKLNEQSFMPGNLNGKNYGVFYHEFKSDGEHLVEICGKKTVALKVQVKSRPVIDI